MKGIVVGIVLLFTAELLAAQTAVPQPVVSDWTQHHVLYPESKDSAVTARAEQDPRWIQNWYLRHSEAWWPRARRWHRQRRRDWSVSLSATPSTAAFEPLFDFTFDIAPNMGYGSLGTTDIGSGQYFATSGFLTVTAGADVGTYPLYPGGPAQTTSPSGSFLYDNVLYPSIAPVIDNNGLLFIGNGLEINIWSDQPDVYEFDDWNGSGYTNDTTGAPVTLTAAPGGGQTGPSKYVFDVNAAPSCTNDFAVIGIPTNPVPGGQANIIGVNNLYSTQGVSAPPPFCGTSGPAVMFAYASGTGQVPAPVDISQNGSQVAYIEDLITGSSYFHVLTIGTTGTNGTGPTAAAVPGVGNNAVDQRVLLSPDGGTTNQSSTNIPFVVYTHNDANDVVYATTYSTAGAGSGYLYKISNVFNGSVAPTIVWSVPITAVPSTPVYDSVSNKIFFTDSNGRIDYVTDNGASPSPVFYGPVLASGNTAENPVILDSTHQMVYATFNSNGTNALVVQAPTSLASSVSVAVGAATGIYTSPYKPDFNNAWYTGTGTPVMYVAGTGATGTIPTLYSIGFNGSGVLNSSADATTAALATGTADSSWLTAFYNSSFQKDYLFVGVTNNCVATIGGGNAGCVMSLDITNGFPTVDASSTALAAPGGVGDIIVDNDSTLNGASSIYYVTKTGVTLVKATQAGLN